MERYIEQLIEEMQEAMARKPVPDKLWEGVDMDNPAEVEDIAHIERYLHGTPEKLSKIVGIDQIQFPPIVKLTNAQVAILYEGMEELLRAFNFYPDFPDDLPVANKYQVLRDQWGMEVVAVSAGESHLEFCDYEPAGCPFPLEFCGCMQVEIEEQQEPRGGADDEDLDMPF